MVHGAVQTIGNSMHTLYMLGTIQNLFLFVLSEFVDSLNRDNY